MSETTPDVKNLHVVDGPLSRNKLAVQRDEGTAKPIEYYVNLPRNLDEFLVLVLDPMLATGGSLSATIDKLEEEGATWISCLHAVAAVPGVERVSTEHPDVTFYA